MPAIERPMSDYAIDAFWAASPDAEQRRCGAD
jgi:hypothetical protein